MLKTLLLWTFPNLNLSRRFMIPSELALLRQFYQEDDGNYRRNDKCYLKDAHHVSHGIEDALERSELIVFKQSDKGRPEKVEYRVEYKKLCKGHDSKDCMKTFVHCCNELGNSEAIVKYIKRELSDVSGICCKGKREDRSSLL